MAHIKQLFDVFKRRHDERDFPGRGVGLLPQLSVLICAMEAEFGLNQSQGMGQIIYFTLMSEQITVNVA